MRLALAMVASLAGATQAFASGGISCTSEEPKAKLMIGSGVTRGMGGPLFRFHASIEIPDKTIAEDLRKTEFEQEHVAQYWLDGQSFKLVLYRERIGDKPFGSVEVIVETQAGDDEGTYNGPYKVIVSDMEGDTTGEGKTVNLEGQTYCFVE